MCPPTDGRMRETCMRPPDQCIRRSIDADGVSMRAALALADGAPPLLLLLHATGFLAVRPRRVARASASTTTSPRWARGARARSSTAPTLPIHGGEGGDRRAGGDDAYAVGHSHGRGAGADRRGWARRSPSSSGASSASSPSYPRPPGVRFRKPERRAAVWPMGRACGAPASQPGGR